MDAEMTPERLVLFAVLTPDGTIIEGRSYYDAMMRACKAGYAFESGNRSAGFVTSRGRFVLEGREALMLAFRAGQLRKNTTLYKSLSRGVVPLAEFRTFGCEYLVCGVGGKNAAIAPPPAPIIAARIDANGATRNPQMNPVRAVHLQEMARRAGYPPDYYNPEGGAQIVSRALKCGYIDGEETIWQIERFEGQYQSSETGLPMPAIEGYALSDGSFITRDEAQERFADADISPERDAPAQALAPNRPA